MVLLSVQSAVVRLPFAERIFDFQSLLWLLHSALRHRLTPTLDINRRYEGGLTSAPLA